MSNMAKKDKIILWSVVGVILAALIALIVLGSYHQLTLAYAFGDTKTFTQEELDGAYESGYNDGCGDQEAYKARIAELEQALIDKENAWQVKYDNMVEYYEGELQKLRDEIARQAAFSQTLIDYLVDFNFDEFGSTTSLAALEMQLAAYGQIADGLRENITYYEHELTTIPNIEALNAEVAAYEAEIIRLNVSLTTQKAELHPWEVIDAASRSGFAYSSNEMYYYLYDRGVVSFTYPKEKACFLRGTTEAYYTTPDVRVIEMPYEPAHSPGTLSVHTHCLQDFVDSIRYSWEVYTGARTIGSQSQAEIYKLGYSQFLTDLEAKRQPVRLTESEIETATFLKSAVEEQVTAASAWKTRAEYILSTSKISLEAINDRIAEVQEKIDNYDEGGAL